MAKESTDREILLSAEVPRFNAMTMSPDSYVPDRWTEALLRGIEKLPLSGKRLLDVGVGPGSLAISLLARHPEIDSIYGSDVIGNLTELAMRNARHYFGDDHTKFIGCPGDLNLLSWLSTSDLRERIDVAYACLPQLKTFSALPNRPDIWAHYYDPSQYPGDFDKWHLGLNEAFLRQAFEFLPPHAAVVVILSGRPPLNILQGLFIHNGFSPTILHEEIMQQDQGSNLQQLVNDEKLLMRSGKDPFRFFLDAIGNSPITAAEAWRVMQSGGVVFHRLYVMLGSR